MPAATHPPDFFADPLLQTLLDVSLTGVIFFEPVYAADGGPEIVDLAYVRLNSAAQRMLQLPERPTETFLTLYPHTRETGIFAFYRDTFVSGEAGRYDVNYQHDGLDNYFHLAAHRSESLLVVSFTDTADHNRTAAETALRESQARERTARAEADQQRERLHSILMQAPAMICLFEGPEHVFGLVNPPYQRLVGERPRMGRPIRDAMPELAGQPIFDLLDGVYRTGETFYAHEALVQLDHANTGGDLGLNHYNFIYQATRNLAGEIDGILVFAYEVTAQVQARRQVEYSRQAVQDLNEELAATNEELKATNEDFLTNNAELARTQQALRHLNQELEARVTDRTREAQAARAEAERQRQRLERLFMQAPAAIGILGGPDFVYELVNPPYQQLFPGRQLLGRPIGEALPEIVDHRVLATFRRVYETGVSNVEIGILIPFVRPGDGVLEDRYFNYIQQARHNESGQIDGVLVFAFETTAQVRAQQRADALQAEVLAAARRQVQEREALYQVFEQTPAAICIVRGPEHRYDYVNPAYQQIFPERQLRGRTFAEALPEAATQGFLDLLDGVYQTGETFFGSELPLLVEQPDGTPASERFFTFTYQAYRENGQIVGISTFAYEVTEQVQARRQREARQAQLQAVFEPAPVAIAIFQGPRYVIELANAAACEIWDRIPEQVLGKGLFEALPEASGQGFEELLNGVRQTGLPHVAPEQPSLLKRDGKVESVYWNFVYLPMRDAQGYVTGVTMVATDATEQVAARREIAQANAELLASNAELGAANQQLTRVNADLDNFIYTASHDLRAPITNLEGLLHALREQLPTEAWQTDQVEQLLTMMQDAVDRFQLTIAQLTDISKLQLAHAQPAEPVDLTALIGDVQLDLAAALTKAGGRLTVNLIDCPKLSFSPKNLRSIFYNLLSNAIKYRALDRPPEIALRCYRLEGATVLEVQDNGLGLTPAQQAKLFTMFQRLHSHVEGSGIGLYMVKKMVENAGGTITVQSQPGIGSTFSVVLPD